MSKSYHMWFLTSYRFRYNHDVNNCVLRKSFLFLSFYIYDGLHKYLAFKCFQTNLNMETIITSPPNFLKHSLHYNMSFKKNLLKHQKSCNGNQSSYCKICHELKLHFKSSCHIYAFTHKVHYRYLSPNHEKSPFFVKVGFKD
jgi:hypothetical protein